MWLPFIDCALLYRGPQQYVSSIVESQNYWWGRPEYPEKTTDLSQDIDQRYHLLLYQVHLAISGIGTHFSGDKCRMKGTTKHELRSLHFIKVKVVYHSYVNCIRPFIFVTYSLKIRRSIGSMSQVVGLLNNSFKPITNAAYVRARLCKLQKRCTRLAAASVNAYQLLACGRWFSPGNSASSTTKTGRHAIAARLLKVALNTKHKNLSIH